ncbi:hypothetical protein PPERSA_00221 [Pseudocohnilembus persalinus]|uniref:Chitin-binding type-4 domain-containing protein n=1 Tax=Pseudocohnilembus persalinus TaxID=266149 RepID=A0A0V0QQC8_PSEPJ|nr:hypothetical protein PPERSA_00221 [Pseudocohnilembus persalinus]|eukprot:KRX04452.1 hypothetical protein PPERSA_00221 [Pseudocohnilembus persalinus]
MKVLILLAALIALASAGFELTGVYTVNNGCDIYTCPATYTFNGAYQFTCPQQGNNNGQITYDQFSQQWTLELRTSGVGYVGGYMSVQFDQSNFVGSGNFQQLQIPLAHNYVLNLMPCYNGPNTSSLCPSSNYSNIMVGWKSYNGVAQNGCNFLLRNESYRGEESA